VSSFALALSGPPILLDGGLATQLEARGHDLSSDLWSARLLSEDPDEVTAAHRDFFVAGAQVATTASYQVSYEGLAGVGIDAAGTTRLLALSVRLARRAAEETPGSGQRWVAASVGPYGASLADGSEYSGDYGLTVAQLRAWHRPRLAALIAAEPDVLALETIPCLAEVEALLAEVSGSGVPSWLSLTNLESATRMGEPLAEAFAMARTVPEIIAVGVNCCSAVGLDSILAGAGAASGKPALAYPNSGEGWDGPRRTWTGEPAFDPTAAPGWVRAGAALVGGCCRVTPDDIAAVRAAVAT
jgi:homocysteine S-methyltransferase